MQADQQRCHTGAVVKHNTCVIIILCKKTWAQIECVCLTPPVNASEQHDFRGVRPAALFMVQWLKGLAYLVIYEQISTFIMWNPFVNLTVLSRDPDSIKHHLLRESLNPPVTHGKSTSTDRKTLLCEQRGCSWRAVAPILSLCSWFWSLPIQLKEIDPTGNLGNPFFYHLL